MNTAQRMRPVVTEASKSYCALIVSPDATLASVLREMLEPFDCHTECVPSYEQAQTLLKSSPMQHVFVDLRPSTANHSPHDLLKYLAENPTPSRAVLAIGGVGYDPAWAHLADVVFQDHLPLPLAAGDLQRSLQARYVARREPLLGQPWGIETGKFRYITYTTSMYPMLNQLVRIAAHDVTLLLVGETGTGKTTMAQMIHSLSPRAAEPFMNVPCGALPPELIESELFGHTRGAFTSADRAKPGKFEVAGRGTILLDEIDVLGAAQQTKLLRVIETGEFESVGSNETRQSQARLIAASNVNLLTRMQTNQFRADLYYRLNVLEFYIPPLRERPNDIVPLTLGFVQEFCDAHKIAVRRIHPDFLNYLKRFTWPGNIRELKNHVRRAVLFCRDGELTPNDLAPSLYDSTSAIIPTAIAAAAPPTPAVRTTGTLQQRMDAAEREIVEMTLQANGYRRGVTADVLDISRVALYKKMKKYGMLNQGPKKPNEDECVSDPVEDVANELTRAKPK